MYTPVYPFVVMYTHVYSLTLVVHLCILMYIRVCLCILCSLAFPGLSHFLFFGCVQYNTRNNGEGLVSFIM